MGDRHTLVTTRTYISLRQETRNADIFMASDDTYKDTGKLKINVSTRFKQ